ncbi:hypothetical protein L218DRAFT_948820 [Marasmius fiardii PR-910]|nr:hypothetical protein L218DRAFT_948820 [Marasmius fiardii PR-910]
MYNSITYSRSQGVEGLFEKLKNLALRLPTPPDAYNFRKRLMLLIPEHIGNVMTSIHKVTTKKSTLTEIMEAAISIEQDLGILAVNALAPVLVTATDLVLTNVAIIIPTEVMAATTLLSLIISGVMTNPNVYQ